jgi:hypothetical protein
VDSDPLTHFISAFNFEELCTNDADHSQGGKPYILALHAGPLIEDPRSNGFTFAAKSEFSSVEDMKYYDTECEAHKTLKANVKTLGVEGMMMIYYDPMVVA